LPESGDGALDIRRFQSEVIESDRALCIRLLKLDERIAAHLNVGGHQLSLWIRIANHLTKSEFLAVPLHGFIYVGHADGNVVQSPCRLRFRTLCSGRLNCGPN